jgi:hypothetical protein
LFQLGARGPGLAYSAAASIGVDMKRWRMAATTALVAWFREVWTVRRLVSAWAAVAVLLVAAVGVAHASPPTAASGNYTQTAHTGFAIGFAGPNVIIEASTVGTVSGTLTGTFEDSVRVVIHPNGRFTAQGTMSCECTVAGKSGVLEFVVVDAGEEVSPDISVFFGHAVITRGSGELSGLRGVLEIAGTVDRSTGLSTIDYSGRIHFHP